MTTTHGETIEIGAILDHVAFLESHLEHLRAERHASTVAANQARRAGDRAGQAAGLERRARFNAEIDYFADRLAEIHLPRIIERAFPRP